MHILVIQTAFIGDAILSSALLEALNAQNDVHSVSILVRKGNENLYQAHPFLRKLHVLDKSLSKLKQLTQMISEIRAESYDVVINCQRFMTTGILTARSGAKVKIGYDKNPMSWSFSHSIPHKIGDGRHEVERLMDLAKPLFGSIYARPALYPSDEDLKKASREGSYVCMAPSSVWFTKQWPEGSWIKLINKIPIEKEILLIGAPSDRNLCDQILAKSERDGLVNLCGEMTLLQSAALMKGASMNYVNDSAPLHLCSTQNAPVTAFFCSTTPDFGFGPLSDTSNIIEHGGNLDCRPCGLHGKKACPLGHFKCAEMDFADLGL